uniref:CSON006949 protein n=1 Tax=Culicoides sonorensis TaxID=179676 RepID=A0A336LCU1_CULSO
MAMYHLQKAFENSLRASSYERPPTSNGTPLKPEIHRGCTGKAHACGTLKNKKLVPEKPQRKNSVSSETISDSGSEGSSSLNSNSAESSQTQASSRDARSHSKSRRKTTDNNHLVAPSDEVDKSLQRPRLASEGDDKLIVPKPKRESPGNFQRSSSFRMPRSSPSPSPSRPPWNSNLGRKDFSPNTKIEVYSRGKSPNVSHLRRGGSFRRKLEGVNWLNIWEQSLGQKSDGANFKHLDKLLESKGSEKVLLEGRLASEPGKVLIQLEHNGEQLTVDEDDIEKANTANLDLCEDICHLKHLNEASVLHVLRQRYASNLIHTRAGPILMVVNPMAPLSLYSEKVVSMFRGCKTEDMPPHVYSLAQTAYRTMMETRRDQSLIFMGRSASGKTTSFKHALYYLTLAAGSTNKLLTAEKVNAMNTILESFGNTKTCMNSNATRFTQILSLDFDHTGQIAAASVQVLLLEKSRAGRRSSNEHTFHVLTRLLAGAEGSLQKELHLDNINFDDSNPFISIPTKLDERAKASSDFVRLVQAFQTLGIANNSVKAIWCVLASIYHLGCAGATKLGTGSTARTQFAHPSSARKAAMLLGVSMDDLTAAAFPVNTSNPGTPTRSPADSPEHSPNAAWDSLEGLVIGLYAEAMSAAVALVNKAISSPSHTIASILLIDTPGFQNPASCGQQTGATLSDLRHNYLQERLQLLFHHTTLVAPRDRYAQELVEIDTEGFIESNPGPLVSLLDKAPQSHVMRTSQRDLRDVDRRGLLWLLDEESMYPNSNDDSFLERLFYHYGDREYQNIMRKGAGTRQFILQHLQGTNPVLYSTSGWLKASREHPSTKNATSLLQDSTKADISHLFIGTLARGGNGIFFGSIAGVEGSQSLRRVSSIRRSFTTAGVKKNSVMLQVKFTVDGIIDTIRRTGTHFVHCFLLQHSAGSSSLVSNKTFHQNSEDIVNVPLLRSQLRGSQILEAARLHRLGFPESVPLTEFIRRFGLLADASSKDITVEQILSHNEIDPSCYRIGPSQVGARLVFQLIKHEKYH